VTSVFTKIMNGELPSYKVYENEYVCGFLTRDAIRLGHTLIVPKVEVDYFLDVPEPFYTEVCKAARIVARAVHRATGCKRVGTVIAGWDVPHFHYHLIPMFEYEDLDPARAKVYSHEENRAMQEKIFLALKSC
jgi:histidine triad (HIT) family protein